MRNICDELKDLIDYIQTVYADITNEWLHNESTKINLSKFLVSDINIDGPIYKSII